MQSETLKPCPVCGDEPKWRGSRHDYAAGIYRLQCLGETHLFQAYGASEEKCIAAWNNRAPTQPADSAGLVERLKYCDEHGIFKAVEDRMSASYDEAVHHIAAQDAEIARLREVLEFLADKADNDALVRELEALASKATKGPWSVFYYDAGDKDNCPSIQAPDSEDCAVIHWDGFKQEYWTSANGDQRQIDANAAMICLLRNSLPTILAALRTPQPDETETLRAEVARLREALGVADAAIKEMFRYYDGGETRGSYDGKPERNQLRKAGYATTAALKGTDHGRG